MTNAMYYFHYKHVTHQLLFKDFMKQKYLFFITLFTATNMTLAIKTPDLHTLNNDLLWAAARNNYPLVIDLLALGANPNTRDISGGTPLLYAISYKHLETVKALLKAGATISSVFSQRPIILRAQDEIRADAAQRIQRFFRESKKKKQIL